MAMGMVQAVMILLLTSGFSRIDFPKQVSHPGKQSPLPGQSGTKSFTDLGISLIIPKIKKDLTIVGVPLTENGWNISWLGNAAGYLAGTAFPTWQGNTVLTGHVYLHTGLPGPFVNINQLKYGDRIQILAWGMKHTYTVVETSILSPDSSEALKHSDQDMLTLITCRSFDPKSGLYLHRTMVRAVLIP